MRMIGFEGSEVGIRILGYQFPDLNDQCDGNWLQVEVEAACDRGRWIVIDPCLEVGEAGRLVEWLRQVGEGAPAESKVEFMEPCLRFELLQSSKSSATIRVYFELGIRPPWSPRNYVGEPDCWLDITTSRAALIEASDGLARALQRFPERGMD